MKVKFQFITCFFLLLLLLSFVSAQEELTRFVESNGFTIEADKSVYYCEPIFSSSGCLIRGTLTVENKNNQNYNVDLEFDFTTPVTMKKHKEMKQSFSKETKVKTDKKVQFKKNEKTVLPFEFWVTDSGKFDYTIDTGLFTVTLDPYYNITVNDYFKIFNIIVRL